MLMLASNQHFFFFWKKENDMQQAFTVHAKFTPGLNVY